MPTTVEPFVDREFVKDLITALSTHRHSYDVVDSLMSLTLALSKKLP